MKDNPVLFGRDPTPGILSVEMAGKDEVILYRHGAATRQPFRPFLWMTEPVLLQGYDRKVEHTTLTGTGELRCLAVFQSWADFQRARQFLRNAPFFAFNDPVTQHLLATGQTHFKQLRFDQLNRLQIALAGDAILLSDNRGWQHELLEPANLAGIVCERDPDIIEAHHIFRNILPQLAGRHPLRIGRDRSVMRSRSSRIQIAEKTIQYPVASHRVRRKRLE